MCDPLNFWGKVFLENENRTKIINFFTKNKGILIFAAALVVFGSALRLWDSQPVFYAQAHENNPSKTIKIKSPLFTENTRLFIEKNKIEVNNAKKEEKRKYHIDNKSSGDFSEKLYAIVGDAPIKEMIPFIAKRNKHTAAFLIAIAKKESGLGEHAPSLDGRDCHNYWGYKGSAGRGSSLGYACFADAEEAIEIVGNRIDVLVSKDRTTPARMVDTWKCGTSCKGDPGAPSWVSTVSLYFEKIVS